LEKNLHMSFCPSNDRVFRDLKDPSRCEITVGDYDKNQHEGYEQKLSASQMIPHPKFNLTAPFINDIGLVQVDVVLSCAFA